MTEEDAVDPAPDLGKYSPALRGEPKDRSERFDLIGRAGMAVPELHEEAGDSERQQVDRSARDCLIRAQIDRRERMHRGDRDACEDRSDDAKPRFARCDHDGSTEERSGQHDSFEGDVHDAGALADSAADRGERERSGYADSSREEVWRDDAIQHG